MKKLTMLVAAAFAMTSAMAQLNPMEPIPADKDVRTGKLENGMTYYIRHNEKPKGQADFHILHDVGAIQENDAQQGLAHFLEHMAFNGTKNLPGKQMIEYLEKVGVKFGANLNAGTSWDMTSYMMKDVPTSREGIIDSALLILHDWSHFIALQPEEIDSERGVIMEELRTRDNASWRSTMKMLQALGKGTKYEHRNLIGCARRAERLPAQGTGVDFYNTWYRPDYQAVVIVGDIDVDAVENKLKTLMSDIRGPGRRCRTERGDHGARQRRADRQHLHRPRNAGFARAGLRKAPGRTRAVQQPGIRRDARRGTGLHDHDGECPSAGDFDAARRPVPGRRHERRAASA